MEWSGLGLNPSGSSPAPAATRESASRPGRQQREPESLTASHGVVYSEDVNDSPDGRAEKGTEAYWAKRDADQAALRLQFIKDQGIPPKRPDPRERLRHR